MVPSESAKKVIIGMSGGVDSAVSAYLLLQQGWQVEGLFMKNWEEDDGTEYCTAIADLESARSACDKLGINLHTANFAAEYWDSVFDDFLQEYERGRTPNPDVLCNREIKFKHFADYAARLGADKIATGHYARWLAPGRLGKARDRNKDQTYFLQAVPAAALERCLFPLGELTKPEVRALAEEIGLHNHDRKDSTGICFIGERRFADFLARYVSGREGDIRDPEGRLLGRHAGLASYTAGQRQGINLGGIAGRDEAPWYVLSKSMHDNTLIVTQDQTALNGQWLRAVEANWLQAPSLPLRAQAKIRYRQDDQDCTVFPAADGRLLIRFDEPQRAISCGQYVALYDGEVLIGGARIDVADPAK